MLGGCQPGGRIYELRSGLKGAASATQAGKARLTAPTTQECFRD